MDMTTATMSPPLAIGCLQHFFPLPEWCERRRGRCDLAAVPLDVPDHMRNSQAAAVIQLDRIPAILGTKAILVGGTIYRKTAGDLWERWTYGHDERFMVAWYGKPENAKHFAAMFGDRLI